MVVRRGQGLLAIFVRTRYSQGFVAEPLVLLQHAVELVLEMAYFHFAGM
jgi:hypothetical protein